MWFAEKITWLDKKLFRNNGFEIRLQVLNDCTNVCMSSAGTGTINIKSKMESHLMILNAT